MRHVQQGSLMLLVGYLGPAAGEEEEVFTTST